MNALPPESDDLANDPSGIRSLKTEISALHLRSVHAHVEMPRDLMVVEWHRFAIHYLECAGLLRVHGPHYWLPIAQLSGQAIEAALKACLEASGAGNAQTHDLVKLYELAYAQGYRLTKPQQAMLIHLSHFYFSDLVTETRYKARYPTKMAEPLGGPFPEHASYVDIVQGLLHAAGERVRGGNV